MLNLGSEMLLPVDEADDRKQATIVVLTTAELAECTCPEFCERDHDAD